MYSREWEPFVRRHKNRKHVVGNILAARLKQSLDDGHNQMLWLKDRLRSNYGEILMPYQGVGIISRCEDTKKF